MKQNEYQAIAKRVRRISLQMAYNAKASHSGGALSMADILTVLYSGKYINISPSSIKDATRDRFVLSKGHCCASLYAILAINGFIDEAELIKNYGKDDTIFYSHVSHLIPGIEASTGSLGHGLPISVGFALGAKQFSTPYSVYCLTGDGELDEGSNWESILFAAHHKMSNLCLIVDYNKLQSMGDVCDIIDLAPLSKKFEAFNWNVVEIDGHNYNQIEQALISFKNEKERPTVIIANTIKGKGVSYMENKIMWHYKNPDELQLQIALKELQ